MPGATTRLALPYPTLAEAADGPAAFQALAAAIDNAAIWSFGTLAARPAASGIAGRMYYATDTGHFYVNTGTAWIDIGPSVLSTDSVTAVEIAANAVGSSELADNAVDTNALQALAVTNAKLASGAVDAAVIAATLKPSGGAGAGTEALRALGLSAGLAMPGDQIVPSAQIADGSITAAKVSATLKPSGSAGTSTEALRALGTAAGTAAAGDDARFLGGLTINPQTASYTLVIGDRGKMVEINNAGFTNLTVPADAVAFAVGDTVNIMQTGGGQVTVVGAGGVTVVGNPGLKLAGQWATATLLKRASNSWVLFGGITT